MLIDTELERLEKKYFRIIHEMIETHLGEILAHETGGQVHRLITPNNG